MLLDLVAFQLRVFCALFSVNGPQYILRPNMILVNVQNHTPNITATTATSTSRQGDSGSLGSVASASIPFNRRARLRGRKEK